MGETPRHSRWQRRAAIAGLFLLALGLRLGYQSQMGASPLWDRPILDEAYNDAWAMRIAASEPAPAEPFFRAPLYPSLLGLSYRIGGHDLGRARFLQALLSALSCLLVLRLARQTFGRPAGWAAALLAATYWPWVYFDGELQDVPLTLALNLAALAVLQRAGPSPDGRLRAAAGGLLLGLSAVARPTVLAVVPAILLWFLWPASEPGGREPAGGVRGRAWSALLLAVGLALPIAPVAARNLLHGHDRVLIASQGGVNFFLGNNPHADGHSARHPDFSAEWAALLVDARRLAEEAEGRELQASEVSRYWFRQGLRFWVERPAAALGLAGRKLAFLIGAPELPNNKQILFFTTRYSSLMRLPWPGYGLVAPLALVGILWGGGGRRAWLIVAFAASYAAAIAAFFVAARFRMPLAAVLIVLAGGGVQALWRLLRERDRGRLAAAIGVCLVSALVVNLPRIGYRENLAHARYTLGNAHRASGALDAAAREYRAALSENPRFSEPRRDLGAVLLEAGRAGEAIAALEPGRNLHPDDGALRFNLALALGAAGRRVEAVELLEDWVGRHPGDPEARVRLGNALAAAGLPERAEAEFVRALELDPARDDARFNLGNALLARGLDADAAAAFRALVEARPEHARGWANLGVSLARLGRMPEAITALGRSLELEPSSAEIRLNLGLALAQVGRGEEARRELVRAIAAAEPGGEVERRARSALRDANRVIESRPSG